jgi:hypothetical protein
MTWSYPIVGDGLIYVADIDEGLYVLRYGGPHQDELDKLAFAEGNSNLTALRPPSPSPSAVAVLPSAPGATATPGGVVRSAPAAGVSRTVVGGGLLVLGLLVVVALLAWRRIGPR